MGTTVADLFAKNTSQDQLESYALKNGFTAHLADTAKVFINVMAPPAPLAPAKGDWNGSTGTDDTAAINACVQYVKSVGGGVVLLPGNKKFKVTAEILIDCSDIAFMGFGTQATIITTSTTKDIIQLADSISRWNVKNLILDRVGVATAGAGINQLGTQALGEIDHVTSQHNYYGLKLGATDSSILKRVVCSYNITHGIYMIPSNNTNGALQWNFDETCNLSLNGGSGLFISSNVAGLASATMGTIERVDTYDNTAYGIAIVGVATTPINGVRIKDCFCGEDVGHNIFLDTYGSMHNLSDCFVELSQSGVCIYITANNTDVKIDNPIVQGAFGAGIYSEADRTIINTPSVFNCGSGVPTGYKNGISFTGKYCSVVGGSSGNNGVSTIQELGIKSTGDNCIFRSVILHNNTINPYNITGTGSGFTL